MENTPGDDATERLAEFWGVTTNEVAARLGGPWHGGLYVHTLNPDAEFFIGREGPSVALLIDPAARRLRIGQAVGHWDGPAQLLWDVSIPHADFDLTTPITDPDLGRAVEAAVAAKKPLLRTCQSCGVLVGPEWSFDDESCMDCATHKHGVVY